MSHDPTTVTEVLEHLRTVGYSANFQFRAGSLSCPNCAETLEPGGISPDRTYRFEGPSDPGDEMIVLALTCPNCAARGTLAAGYGASASPEEAAFLRAVSGPQA